MAQFNFAEIDNPQSQEPPETLPATRSLDIEAAKRAFEPYRQKIAQMQEAATALEIHDDEGEKSAVDSAAKAKRLDDVILLAKQLQEED